MACLRSMVLLTQWTAVENSFTSGSNALWCWHKKNSVQPHTRPCCNSNLHITSSVQLAEGAELLKAMIQVSWFNRKKKNEKKNKKQMEQYYSFTDTLSIKCVMFSAYQCNPFFLWACQSILVTFSHKMLCYLYVCIKMYDCD